MKKHIPNTITCLNLISGMIAIIYAMQWHYLEAACFIALAAVFDFADGLAARLLHAQSSIGKDLDSLSDVVSFGVAPGMIVFNYLIEHASFFVASEKLQTALACISFLIPVLSAVRLARFNHDEHQTENFIGLPTPANALFFAFYIASIVSMNVEIQSQFYIVIALTITGSLLLNSKCPMFSLKFKTLKWKDNKIRYVFLGCAVILIAVIWNFIAIPLVIGLYVVLSLINRWIEL